MSQLSQLCANQFVSGSSTNITVEGDALAAPQGRAEDVLIAAIYKLLDKVALRTGYRILEGGADNDEVYNFSLFNCTLVGLSITL